MSFKEADLVGDRIQPRRMPLWARLLVTVLISAAVTTLAYLGLWVGHAYDDVLVRGTEETHRFVREVERRIEFYREHHGVLPSSLAELDSDPELAKLGQFFHRSRWSDYWGRELQYSVVDGRPRIVSLGHDGKPGGVGHDLDITSQDDLDDLTGYGLTLQQFWDHPVSDNGLVISGLAGFVAALLTLHLTRRSTLAQYTWTNTVVTIALNAAAALVMAWIEGVVHLIPRH